MKVCPQCQGIKFDNSLQNCPICGSKMVADTVGTETEPGTKLSISINFSTITCDQCEAVAPFSAVNTDCPNCGETLSLDDSLQEETGDPIVRQRREWLQPLYEMRSLMLEQIEEAQDVVRIADEEESRTFIVQALNVIKKRTTTMHEYLSTTDFSTEGLQSRDSAQLRDEVREHYQMLFDETLALYQTVPHSTWLSFYDSLKAGALTYMHALLGVLDILGAESFSDAKSLMMSVQKRLDEAGEKISELSAIVSAGKKLRYGTTIDIAETLSSFAAEHADPLAIAQMGSKYFSNLLSVNVKEVAPEDGLTLTVMAIVGESLERPGLLKDRAKALTNLFRQAHQVKGKSVQAASEQAKVDIRQTTRFLMDIGVQYAAIDFGQLHTPQRFNLALDTYQRLAEGSFKHLLTFILFCERLTRGMAPSYEDISLESFGNNVRYGANSLANCPNPVLAGIADDLILYIRHADAHCDFLVEADKVIIYERDYRPPRQVIESHEYTEDEFTDLVSKLFEAVFAMLIAVLVFQIEHRDDYSLLESDVNKLLADEKVEACKWYLAINGILTNSFFLTDDSFISIQARAIDGITLTTKQLVPSLVAIACSFPTVDAIRLEVVDHGRVIGTIAVPATKFRPSQTYGRAGQLRYVEVAFRIVSNYVDNPRVIGVTLNTSEEIYCQYFLKWMIMYIYMIFHELFTARHQLSDLLTRKKLRGLSVELTLIQNLLVTYQPPQRQRNHHTLAINNVQEVMARVRELDLLLRPKSVSEKKLHDVAERLERAKPEMDQLALFARDANQKHKVRM